SATSSGVIVGGVVTNQPLTDGTTPTARKSHRCGSSDAEVFQLGCEGLTLRPRETSAHSGMTASCYGRHRLFSEYDLGGKALPRTGFIDHIGIGVPDLEAAKAYYDELMSILGLREWFPREAGGPLNYGPDGARGSQLFIYQADDTETYSRGHAGLHHL